MDRERERESVGGNGIFSTLEMSAFLISLLRSLARAIYTCAMSVDVPPPDDASAL